MQDLTQDPTQLHVEENVQVFLDNLIIHDSGYVTRRWHQPTRCPEGPVIQKDRPWEHVPYFTYSNYAVLHDDEDGLFKCWYEDLLDGPDYRREERYFEARQLYAQSEDGIHWEKPELDILPQDGRKTNVVLGGGAYGTAHSMSVVIDPHAPTPAEKFRALWTRVGKKGKEFDRIECAHSPDGIHWQLYDQLPSFGISGARLEDVSVLFYDEDARQFVQNTRHFLKSSGRASTPHGGMHHFGSRYHRRVWQCRSHDFIHWSEPILVAAADPDLDNLDKQFYGMAQYKLGNLNLATVGVFRQTDNEMDVHLLVSRDGTRWKRTAELQPFLAPRGQGFWDTHMVSIVSPPIRVDDELWFYHGGTTSHHDWWMRNNFDHPEAHDQSLTRYCLGLARLRCDGYVGLYASKYIAGSLVTQSMMSRGTKLVLNAKCGLEGSIHVEVQDNYGQVIEPCSKDNCDPVSGDSVEHAITWKGNPTVPVRQWRRLAFTLRDAELFSFRFTESAPP